MDSVDDTAAQLARGPAPDPLEDETASMLILVLDLHGEGWERQSKTPFWDVMSSLLVFLNAHLALDSANQLALIGFNGLGARLIHSTVDLDDSLTAVPPQPATSTVVLEGTMVPQFRQLDEMVISGVKRCIDDAAATEKLSATTSIAGGLSLALTYLNRILRTKGSMRGHILTVSANSTEVGSKYIPAMNSIFTAQKLRVPIDVANFGPSKSFLQQAADFTGGSYLELRSHGARGLVEFFTSVFLVEPSVRQYVNLPTQPDVDFGSVCFLTNKVIEIGYVCSVCLCIMETVPNDKHCPVCRTKYEIDDPRTLS